MTEAWPEYWRSEPSDPADPNSVAEWIAVNRPEPEEIRRAVWELCEHARRWTEDDVWIVPPISGRSL